MIKKFFLRGIQEIKFNKSTLYKYDSTRLNTKLFLNKCK